MSEKIYNFIKTNSPTSRALIAHFEKLDYMEIYAPIYSMIKSKRIEQVVGENSEIYYKSIS